MAEHKLNITWSEFAGSASKSFQKLWLDTDFTDVTLATSDDLQIHSHKVILSSCSSFFRHVLQRHPHQKPLLYLKDVRHRELELIIQFIYKGECQVEQEHIEEFLAVGRALKINGLKEQETEEGDSTAAAASTNIKQEPVDADENNSFETTYKIYSCESISYPGNNGKQSGGGGGGFSCDMCYFVSSKESSLRKHKLNMHHDSGSDRSTGSQWDPQFHEGSKRKKRSKNYRCDMCDFKAGRLRILKHHKVTKHEADKPFPCDQCDYQALSAHILKIHKTSKHDRVLYSCDQCDYTTNWQANLTTHKRKKHIEPQEELALMQYPHEDAQDDEDLALSHLPPEEDIEIHDHPVVTSDPPEQMMVTNEPPEQILVTGDPL